MFFSGLCDEFHSLFDGKLLEPQLVVAFGDSKRIWLGVHVSFSIAISMIKIFLESA
jgi:hypothetical protein